MNLLNRLLGGGKPEAKAPELDERLVAVAALLIEAARADEQYTEEERSMIREALASAFGVPTDACAGLLAEAERRQESAVDIHRFTKAAKTLTPHDKIRLVEALWRVILSDSVRDAFEDALMRRICGLLHVEDIESGLARQRVREELDL